MFNPDNEEYVWAIATDPNACNSQNDCPFDGCALAARVMRNCVFEGKWPFKTDEQRSLFVIRGLGYSIPSNIEQAVEDAVRIFQKRRLFGLLPASKLVIDGLYSFNRVAKYAILNQLDFSLIVVEECDLPALYRGAVAG